MKQVGNDRRSLRRELGHNDLGSLGLNAREELHNTVRERKIGSSRPITDRELSVKGVEVTCSPTITLV